jgi:hypothetical protein
MAATALAGVAVAGSMAACSDSVRRTDTEAGPVYTSKSTVTPEGQRGAFSRKGAGSKRQIAVNGFLWRAALDSVSFMPLISADPYGGAIITDWYSPPETPNERIKLTVLVQGAELRSDGVKVTVFKQKRDEKRGWVDAAAAKNTGYDLENVILARARDLREQRSGQ